METQSNTARLFKGRYIFPFRNKNPGGVKLSLVKGEIRENEDVVVTV